MTQRQISEPFLFEGELVVSVPLTMGKFAIVDFGKLIRVQGITWTYAQTGRSGNEYAVSYTLGRMHNVIAQCEDGKVWDHRNGNGLDNRISNLRPATRSQNCMNARMMKNNVTGVKGVTWDSSNRKWRAVIQVDYRQISLGRFSSLEEARAARERGEQQYFGDFTFGGVTSTPQL